MLLGRPLRPLLRLEQLHLRCAHDDRTGEEHQREMDEGDAALAKHDYGADLGRWRMTTCESLGTCMSRRCSTNGASTLRLDRLRTSLSSCARTDSSCTRRCS